MNAKSKSDIEWDEKKKKEIKYGKIKGSNEIKEMERKDKQNMSTVQPTSKNI